MLERFGGEEGTGGPKQAELGRRAAKLEQELTISQHKVLSLQEVLQRSVPPERAAEVLGASLSAARALIPMAEEASAREAGLIAQVRVLIAGCGIISRRSLRFSKDQFRLRTHVQSTKIPKYTRPCRGCAVFASHSLAVWALDSTDAGVLK